jgi:sugar transferase (PEP-CTERM/EpsH1 system associated)
VCHLLHSLKVGGAEVLTAQLARQLRDTFRFIFVCLDELGGLGEELGTEGFRVEVLARRPGVDWRCMFRLARLLRHEHVDLVHAHQYTPFFYGMAARLLGRKLPILFTEHGRHFPDFPRRKRMLANRLLLRRRDRVVGVGQAVRQAVIANEGIPPERVSVIYNGVDAATFTADFPQRERIRSDLGLSAGDLVILQVARLDYLKDHATAVRTIKRVAARHPEVRLILVGDGPEQEKIQAEIRRCDLGRHIRLLGLRNDVGRLLHAADVFLLTSISEGIPLTAIEAMNAGLPVVATRVGGLPEIVVQGRTGVLAPSRDDEELADCILRLAADPALRAAMGRAGRERARAVFSQSRMHQQYLELYQEMLDE